MQPTRHPRPRRLLVRLVGGLALVAGGFTACVPAVGFSSPFHGEAVHNAATTNYEGRMTACTVDGGPVTVVIDSWGFDLVHPFLAEVTSSDGSVLSSRTVLSPADVLVTQPLVRGTCFGVRITSPGASGRSYYTYTVTW